jgi:DNA-binding MarR family transcriptional regulator
MLGQAEGKGLLKREPDETDKRMQHISLTERGNQWVTGMAEAQQTDAAKKTACFTEEEKIQMAKLCEKLSAHLERLAIDAPVPEPVKKPKLPPGARIRC